ncbi:MAG: hypothetical protein ABIU63_15810 [Chitinophagaceae bacterium]
MKKLWLVLVICGACCSLFAQTDPLLQQRLNYFMEANRQLHFDSVIAYTYPKLFTLVPRDEMLEMLQNSFENEQLTIRLDSLQTDSIYPVFKMQEGSYAKIRYSLNMIMQLKDSSAAGKENDLLAAMQAQYGTGKVRLDSAKNIVVQVTALMLAAKDKYARQWCFVNLKDSDPLISQLFTKEIIDKTATYK